MNKTWVSQLSLTFDKLSKITFSLTPHFKESFYHPFICTVQFSFAFQLLNEWMQKQHKLFQYHHQTQLYHISNFAYRLSHCIYSLLIYSLLSYRVSYCQALVVAHTAFLACWNTVTYPSYVTGLLPFIFSWQYFKRRQYWVSKTNYLTIEPLCSSSSSVFSKVCVLWWGFQPWPRDWRTHHNCQIFYAVQTYSPHLHAPFWRLYCRLQECGAEYRFHVRLFLARCLFDVSSFDSQVGLQSVQNFWQLQPPDNKCISMVVTSSWYSVNICFCHSLLTWHDVMWGRQIFLWAFVEVVLPWKWVD